MLASYMASVKLKPGESQEALLRRFRKRVTNAGILSTVRRKRWHISKSELRRIEKKKEGAGQVPKRLQNMRSSNFYCRGLTACAADPGNLETLHK